MIAADTNTEAVLIFLLFFTLHAPLKLTFKYSKCNK